MTRLNLIHPRVQTTCDRHGLTGRQTHARKRTIPSSCKSIQIDLYFICFAHFLPFLRLKEKRGNKGKH